MNLTIPAEDQAGGSCMIITSRSREPSDLPESRSSWLELSRLTDGAHRRKCVEQPFAPARLRSRHCPLQEIRRMARVWYSGRIKGQPEGSRVGLQIVSVSVTATGPKVPCVFRSNGVISIGRRTNRRPGFDRRNAIRDDRQGFQGARSAPTESGGDERRPLKTDSGRCRHIGDSPWWYLSRWPRGPPSAAARARRGGDAHTVGSRVIQGRRSLWDIR